MQNLSNLLARRRATYSILIGIILLTLPCYIIGIVALAIAPGDSRNQPAQHTNTTTPELATDTGPAASATVALVTTPTQFTPPTATSQVTAKATETPAPTNTSTSTAEPTMTATSTLPPTVTSTPPTPPTLTPTSSETVPVSTQTPTDTPTFTATATNPPPTETPTVTPAP